MAAKEKPEILIEGRRIERYSAVLESDASSEALERGKRFSDEAARGIVADFEKPGDCMAHVSTFVCANGMIYMSYYANTSTADEDPNFQTARLAYCPKDDPEKKTYIDIQSAGDDCGGKKVIMVYDTILMQKDERTLLVLWTANLSGTYYRLYRTFDMASETLGDVCVNRFKVGEVVNDFSTDGISGALRENGVGVKTMYSDIGIMQKLTSREERGVVYYYTGAYSGDFNCIIKSADLIKWEYVSQPDFPNLSKWENAVYVRGDKCYYFVRQQGTEKYGFLTAYDLNSGAWDTPVLIADCQSRSDFIEFGGELYLVHAPVDRDHIGVVKIDTADISRSAVVLQADMNGSCFYPYVRYGEDGGLMMSYTVARKHIRLARLNKNEPF